MKDSLYVDNCVTSLDSLEELQVFRKEATAVMAAGGFELRGWENSGEISENKVALVLGVFWNKSKDTISINPDVMDMKISSVLTKRSLLSISHRIFDPIGFTSLVSLKPKILLKQLREEKVEWDVAIDKKREDEFLIWLKELPLTKEIEISREIGEGSLSLHAFGDASKLAYAAVVFARIVTENSIGVQLLGAKSNKHKSNST